MKKAVIALFVLFLAIAAPSGAAISPKISFSSGDFSGASIGVEYDIFSLKDLNLSADLYYKPESNNVSWLGFGIIGKNDIDVANIPVVPYVGFGTNFNIYNINGGGAANGIGFKMFAGGDFKTNYGVFFGNLGYSWKSFNYSLGLFSYSANGNGLFLDAGYRVNI